MAHRNWFLVIVEKYIITITWIALLVSILLTAATYLFDSIYSAKIDLMLDASMAKVLPQLESGVPSTTAIDYIRQEYFAINSVNLMQQPEIGETVISGNALVDARGEKINVNDFINPSTLGLLFKTNGQGITINWISDTQQFSITGYGKDIETAALLASLYTDAFIAYDKNQFRKILETLLEQKKIEHSTAIERRHTIALEQIALREKYGVANWEARIGSLNESLTVVEEDIFLEKMAESTATQRLNELESQLEELKVPVHSSRTEQKNSVLTSLQLSLADLIQQLAAASIEYTPNHPAFRMIEEQIDSVSQQIRDETLLEYSESRTSTSEVMDDILADIMQNREDRVVRTIRLALLNAKKKHYLEEINFLGNGQSLYDDLDGKKERLNDIIQTTMQDIISIQASIETPFSFFRPISEPHVDLENIKDARSFPERKKMLILSFFGIFLLGLFYVLVRELHLETLFYAWQLTHLPEGVEPIDIVCKRRNKISQGSLRHIFNSSESFGKLLRVRKLDWKSDPRFVAKLGADYFVQSGGIVLLVNNRQEQLDKEQAKGRGMQSWLTGHTEDIAAGIQRNKSGYDILSDSQWNPVEPWVKTGDEIKELFSDFAEKYSNTLLLDPSLHSERRVVGDLLSPDIDILTVKGGSLAVGQALEYIQQEKQTSEKVRTVILVINDKVSVNIFSVSGFFRLALRFCFAPFEVFLRR